MTQKRPFKKTSEFYPEPLSIDDLGWEAFLGRWNEAAMEAVRELLLRFGIYPGQEESRKYIRETLKEQGVHLPEEVFQMGFPYPPVTEIDRRQAEARLKCMTEAMPNIRKVRPDWFDSLEWRALENQGLRFPGLGGENIRRIEDRIHQVLPPSYKAFLSTSNGWILSGVELLSASNIGLFSAMEPDAFRIWTEEESMGVSDEEYYQYDLTKQDPVKIRTEYLTKCLVISRDYSESTTWYLLNPEIRFEDGEWEVWKLNTESPGARRFRSFARLMEWLYRREIAAIREHIYRLSD